MITRMDRSEICEKFLDQLQFEPYPFQEEALLAWYEAEGGILVTAPTGMGKTLIAESAIFEALHLNQRMYYTSPLIALTDQKFREFQELVQDWGFPKDRVGLITGNRKVNPEAPIQVVVAEILLNHLLSNDPALNETAAVVMDEFHYFNDWDRGIVWELALVLLPAHVRLMLLSATVGNAPDFIQWLKTEHGRHVQLIHTNERRVPLEFEWIEDRLLTELLPKLVADADADNRTPALVFCFNRDECWEIAERLKGADIIDKARRTEIEKHIDPADFKLGIGPKLRQMLIRGVGVHHAGVLPKHKEVVERLFLEKLIPLVTCTETLAAGINLPARSVVVTALMKGPRDDKKLIPPSSAHQMFGRAGRPQFDTQGYVFSMAHEDDIKINKWKKKYEQIDPTSKDPGIMRARKQLERKKPSRRKNVRYWTDGQFRTLIEAGPAPLASRSMIPYQVFLYLLSTTGSLKTIREFLGKRFNDAPRIEKFVQQLEHMIDNLATFGYLTRNGEDDVTLSDTVARLGHFRSIDPLYGAFIGQQLARADFSEKVQILESALPTPPALRWKTKVPDYLEPGPLQATELGPALIKKGLLIFNDEGLLVQPYADDHADYYDNEDRRPAPGVAEMVKLLFDAHLATPEDILVQPKWIASGIFEANDDFYGYTQNRELSKQEGIVLRHLLRLVILAGELHEFSGEDPDYNAIADRVTKVCTQVDPRYTDHFLADQQEVKALAST